MHTLVWKFPGTREARLWTLTRIAGDTAYFHSEDHLAIASVDVAEGVGVIAANDQEGGRVRAFAAKERLCDLVEDLIKESRRPGASGQGGFQRR